MKFLTVLFILLLIFCAIAGAVLWWSSAHSTLAFEPPPKAIGAATPVVVRIDNPHGVRHVTRASNKMARATLFSCRIKSRRAASPSCG